MKGLMMRQVVAVIDERTTMTCLRAAGQVVPAGVPFEVLTGLLMDPPFHWGCRSIVVPWVPGAINDQKSLANAEIQERPPEERRFGPNGYEGKIPAVPAQLTSLSDLKPPQHLVDALGSDLTFLAKVPVDGLNELLTAWRSAAFGTGAARSQGITLLLALRDRVLGGG